MQVFPVILDTRPSYLRRQGAPPSLLLTPVGTGLLLHRVKAALAAVKVDTPRVLADFAVDEDYATRVRAIAAQVEEVAPVERLSGLLNECELSDCILIIDPRCYPVRGLDLRELISAAGADRSARHLVAMDTQRRGTKEYVQLDADGRVQRIQRYYDGVTWLQAQGVLASLIPVPMLREVVNPSVRGLAPLRRLMAAHGFVNRDIGLAGGIHDLRTERGLLHLSEQHLRNGEAPSSADGYRHWRPGVVVGPNCTIDPTARLYAPVVVQAESRVEAETTIIGPTLIGTGSRIEQGAVVAQCLTVPGTRVGANATFHHRLLCGDETERPSDVEVWDNDRGGIQVARRDPARDDGDEAAYRRRERYVQIKRVAEGILSALGLLLLSPLLLLVALLNKLTSRGPVFFGHEREGKDGQLFRCYKFRTMIDGAHFMQRALYKQNEVDGPQFKMDHDPRISRLGHLLRKTNIDELPQLWNVLCGQMSLIGPRPSPFRENQICVPWRKARLAVRPGITGLWQVCRSGRAQSDFHQWIYYDILYVRHLSFWLDVKILLATLVTLGGRWSMPVHWIIPSHKARAEDEYFLALDKPPVEPLAAVSAEATTSTSAGVVHA